MEQNNIRILIVEDQVIARKMAVMIFESLHCKVDAVANGMLALDMLVHNKYELIFLDLGLPHLDGFAVAEKIRDLESEYGKPRAPIIALSARNDSSYEQRCIETGMDACLEKPLTRENAEEMLDKFVRKIIHAS